MRCLGELPFGMRLRAIGKHLCVQTGRFDAAEDRWTTQTVIIRVGMAVVDAGVFAILKWDKPVVRLPAIRVDVFCALAT